MTRKDFNCDTFVGVGASVIALTLLESGCRPLAEILWPRYSTSGSIKAHFSHLRRIPADSKWLSTVAMLCISAASDSPVANMSSR